jgi:hypothetical protein
MIIIPFPKQLKMSDRTLAKALANNVMYNNHYFRMIGSKMKCGDYADQKEI